jgi:hypothetical protein
VIRDQTGGDDVTEEGQMKWSIILAMVLVTFAGVVMPSPANAGFCQNKRTTAIKKFHHHQFSQGEVESKCFSAVKKRQ